MPHTKMEKILLEPEKFFERVAKEKIGEAVRYLAYWALFPAAVSAIAAGYLGISFAGLPTWLVSTLFSGTALYGSALGIATGIGVYLGVVISVLASTIVAHGVAMVFKARDFEQTLKAVVYGASPFYAFGWMPIFGVLFGLYSVIVQLPAFRNCHRMNHWHAVLTVFGTILLIGVLCGTVPPVEHLFSASYPFEIATGTIQQVVAMMR